MKIIRNTLFKRKFDLYLMGRILGEILQSEILKENPLDLFGIKETDLIDIISNALAEIDAFLSTIIEIAQNNNLLREN